MSTVQQVDRVEGATNVEESERLVVVIGAGVVGAAIALELARRGRPTLLLDRNHAPGHGSTAASSAVVRFTYSTVAGTAMPTRASNTGGPGPTTSGCPTAGRSRALFRAAWSSSTTRAVWPGNRFHPSMRSALRTSGGRSRSWSVGCPPFHPVVVPTDPPRRPGILRGARHPHRRRALWARPRIRGPRRRRVRRS